MGAAEAKAAIIANKTALGIEFGSTRIKAVLVDDKNQPIASGAHEWENRYENGVWTYSLDDIWTGIQDCYQDMAKDVKAKYDVELESVGAFGVSAMMHGYMPFNKDGELLVPFRTWRNNITGEASEKLMELFNYNIPQRWSIAHPVSYTHLENEFRVGEQVNYRVTVNNLQKGSIARRCV